jgi:hypothetical protein
MREYYMKNKGHIQDTMNVTFHCECGMSFKKHDYSRHMKTKKHARLMKLKDGYYAETINKINGLLGQIPSEYKTIVTKSINLRC